MILPGTYAELKAGAALKPAEARCISINVYIYNIKFRLIHNQTVG
jgi:hypothetical protein